MRRVWHGAAGRKLLPLFHRGHCDSRAACGNGRRALQGIAVFESEGKGGWFMKVVVVKSPRVFRGILRFLFGIKKQDAM